MFTENDKNWMQKALSLAGKGGHNVRPNPLVGAVIVKNSYLVGSGYHKQHGGPHAEIIALKKAGKHAKGAMMYLTLEPCNHYGKTPPCTDAIISSGIKKVIAAMRDPNPKVSGKGIKKLKSQGVDISVGLLGDCAQEINRVYIKNITKNEPYVILKMAQTLDGKIASHTGDSKWISDECSRNLSHRWRAQSEAVMVGSNTVLKDNPRLTSHGMGRDPLRVIIDPDKKILKYLKVFDNKGNVLVVSENTLSNFKSNRSNGRINLKNICKELFKRGIYQLIIEGGGTLSAYALEDGIVDEIRFFIAPKILGGKDALTSVEGKGISRISKAIKVKQWTYETVGSDLLVRGYIN